MLEPRLQLVIESLCGDGCRTVRQHIADIEHGHPPCQLGNLNPKDQQAILTELKDIMSVYDRCEI